MIWPWSFSPSGSCGSGRAAGPKIGRAPSSTANVDWWHGHSSRPEFAWYSPTGQPDVGAQLRVGDDVVDGPVLTPRPRLEVLILAVVDQQRRRVRRVDMTFRPHGDHAVDAEIVRLHGLPVLGHDADRTAGVRRRLQSLARSRSERAEGKQQRHAHGGERRRGEPEQEAPTTDALLTRVEVSGEGFDLLLRRRHARPVFGDLVVRHRLLRPQRRCRRRCRR